MKKKKVSSIDMNKLRWKNGVTEADKKRLKEISKLALEKRWGEHRKKKKATEGYTEDVV